MSVNIGTQQYDQSVYDVVQKNYNKTQKTSASKTEAAQKKPAAGKTSAAEQSGGVSKANESKLSSKAQEFLKNLRKQYGDYDIMVGNSSDDLKALSKSGSKEFSVIFSNEELERMADDEKYAKEKMQCVETAVNMSKKISEQDGMNGTINKVSITVGDDGSVKIFAELEKTSAKQKERIEKSREKKAEDKKAEEKKAKDSVRGKNPYEEAAVKRTTIEASSEQELFEKIRQIDWDSISESKSGDRFSYSV